MLKRLLTRLSAVLLCAACSSTYHGPRDGHHELNPSKPNWVSYTCEGNVRFSIDYHNHRDDRTQYARLRYNNADTELKERTLPSGNLAYFSINEQQGYRWYPISQGGELKFLAADHTASEKAIGNHCIRQN